MQECCDALWPIQINIKLLNRYGASSKIAAMDVHSVNSSSSHAVPSQSRPFLYADEERGNTLLADR